MSSPCRRASHSRPARIGHAERHRRQPRHATAAQQVIANASTTVVPALVMAAARPVAPGSWADPRNGTGASLLR
jgi:hypothetical protein